MSLSLEEIKKLEKQAWRHLPPTPFIADEGEGLNILQQDDDRGGWCDLVLPRNVDPNKADDVEELDFYLALIESTDTLLSMAKRSIELEKERQSETLIGRKIKVPQYVSVLSDPISYEVRTLEKYKHCIGYFQTDAHREAGDFKPLCDESLYERGPDSEDRYLSHYGSYVSNQVQAWIDLAPESEASND